VDECKPLLSGTVPVRWMTDMTSLFTLDLSFNRLQGEFPQIGAGLTRIRRLYLGHNRFLAGHSLTTFSQLALEHIGWYVSGMTHGVRYRWVKAPADTREYLVILVST